jgi:hypothetical protein
MCAGGVRYQVPRLRRAVDQIAFPVSDHGTRFYLRRSRVDHALVRDLAPSPTVQARTAPPPLAVCPRQVLPQIPAGPGIGVDMLVDRLLAYPLAAFPPRPPADDLRSPSLQKPLLGIQAHRLGKPPGSRPLGPFSGLPVRLLPPVALLAPVPAHFPADASCVTPQPPGHLTNPTSFSTPTVDQPTLFVGHAFVSHYALHVLLVHEERTLPRDHLHLTRVAMAARARAAIDRASGR